MPNSLLPRQPRNALYRHPDPMMNVVPSPGWEQRMQQPAPAPFSPLQYLDEFTTGLSRGVGGAYTGNLQLIYDLATRPRGVYQDLVASAQDLMKDPSMIRNMLSTTAAKAASGPQGMGEVIGGIIDPRSMLKRGRVMSDLDVHHGTPHTFEPEEGAPLGKFKSQKIGTGEGAQAFGIGHYLAENRQVGGGYREKLVGKKLIDDIQKEFGTHRVTADELQEWIDSGEAPADLVNVANTLGKQDDWLGFDYPAEAIATAFDRAKNKNFEISDSTRNTMDSMGNLYKVDLPDEMIPRMLDWDKPIGEQPQILAALESAAASKGPNAEAAKQILSRYNQAIQSFGGGRVKGEHLYDSLVADVVGGKAKASEFLRTLGIPGVRYLDRSSRKAGEGTRNFVVFPGEEGSLTIKSKE